MNSDASSVQGSYEWIIAAEAREQASKQARRERIETRSAEEHKSSAYEDFTCDLNTLCVLQCSGVGSVWLRETFMVPVLQIRED
jgi:hypothetical protein